MKIPRVFSPEQGNFLFGINHSAYQHKSLASSLLEAAKLHPESQLMPSGRKMAFPWVNKVPVLNCSNFSSMKYIMDRFSLIQPCAYDTD